jgi:REP element-mobilizing transposase RayT
MGGHKIENQNHLHFVTLTTVGWVDVFTRKAYKDIIIESLKYCQEHKGLMIFAYVIMSNHLHLIVRTDTDSGLSAILRDFKKFTANKIIKEIQLSSKESRRDWMLRLFTYYAKFNKKNTTFQLWQNGNHPIELISPKWINRRLLYIHDNPIRAGIVESQQDYLYSSARNYYDLPGKLEVVLLHPGDGVGYIYSGS